MAKFSWGTPVNITRPPFADTEVPASFHELSFSPLGLYNLRRMLGALPDRPGAYNAHQDRFDAADIAWFAAGLSSDGRHGVPPDRFHKELINVYKCAHGNFPPETRKELKKKVEKLVLDVITLWDRCFGGSTMLLHTDGTSPPGTPASSEFIQARVYLPPILDDVPEAHDYLAAMVQCYIEKVGVATKLRWVRVGRLHLGWNLSTHGPTPVKLEPPQSAIPYPIAAGSGIYLFVGRRAGEMSLAIQQAPQNSQPQTSGRYTQNPPPAVSDDPYSNPVPPSFYEAVEVHLRHQNNFKELEQNFRAREEGYLERIGTLEKEVENLRSQLLDSSISRTFPSMSSLGSSLGLSLGSPSTATQIPATSTRYRSPDMGITTPHKTQVSRLGTPTPAAGRRSPRSNTPAAMSRLASPTPLATSPLRASHTNHFMSAPAHASEPVSHHPQRHPSHLAPPSASTETIWSHPAHRTSPPIFEPASRAIGAAHILGYKNADNLNRVMRGNPVFWHSDLQMAGYEEEDIPIILKGLYEDAPDM